MERWNATYEARVPESDLNNLAEKAKSVSKTGMQLTVGQIDFSPTLEETQTALSQLRTVIYKQANEQLATLNAAIQGRTYRIAAISFNGAGGRPLLMEQNMRAAKALHDRSSILPSPAGEASAFIADSQPMERAEKLVITAHVTLAAEPKPAASPAKP